MVSDYPGADYTFCPETVELWDWDDVMDPDGCIEEVVHSCDKGEGHEGAHECSCGQSWDMDEVSC